MCFFTLTRAPVTLERLVGGWYDNSGQLINGWYDYRITVTGESLEKHRDLLTQLTNAKLAPAESESFADARLHYVFEHEKYGELFSFLAFGDGYRDTIVVNGVEVEHNSVFFEIVLPFLPEDAIETIKQHLNNREK